MAQRNYGGGTNEEPFSTLEVVDRPEEEAYIDEKKMMKERPIVDEKETIYEEPVINEKECVVGPGGGSVPEVIFPPPSQHEKQTEQRPQGFWSKWKVAAFISVGLLLIGVVVGGAVGGSLASRSSGRDIASGAKGVMSGSATAAYTYVYPTAVSSNPSTVNVLAVGSDLSMHEKVENATTQPLTSSWSNLGRSGIFPGIVSAVSRKQDTIDAFARGLDGALYHKAKNTSIQWTPGGVDWDDLGGVITTTPEVVSWGDERLDVFVISADSALWQRTWDSSMWYNWTLVGGSWSFDAMPTAVSWAKGRIDVFLMNPDTKELFHRFLDNNATNWQPFYGFHNLKGYLAGRPSVVSWAVGRLDLFVRGGDEGLWHLSYSGDTDKWSDWTKLGKDIQGEPSAVSLGKNRLDVFVWGKDYSYYRKTFDGSSWTPKDGYESLGGTFSGPPKAVARSTGKIDLFGCSSRATVLHKAWDDGLKAWTPQTGFEDWQAPVLKTD